MSPLSRRDMLKTAAQAATAATLLDGCKSGHHDDAFSKPRHKAPVPGSDVPRGTEEHVTSVCGQCQAGCALSARVVEGRAIKLEGLGEFPINGGTLGPKGQSGTELLYHRDVLKGPLRRDGPKGSGRFKPATWDEAIAAVGAELKALREKGEARSLVVLDGQSRGPIHDLWHRFTHAFGTPNLVDHRATTDGAKALASLYMQGVNELPAYDWDRTRYVLGLGPGHLESGCQMIHMMRAASALRVGVMGKRVKFVDVSARYSVTASKADEWVQIKPGTYGLLALGLGHVLVRDGLHDARFIAEHTFGFEDFKDQAGQPHRGFKDVLMSEGAPEQVASVTGIDAETIVRLAHELVDYGPAVVLGDARVGSATNGLYSAMAIHALNALLGNIGKPGGVALPTHAPLKPWAEVALDAAATQGLAAPRLDGAGTVARPLADGAVHALAAGLVSGPYPAGAVLMHYSNPAFSKPGGKKWLDALAKVPLVVSFSPLPDESMLVADWVLPDATSLERWELVEPAPSTGAAVLGLRQPVVKAQHDRRASGEVLIALAKAVGGPVAAAFPWEGYRQALEERLEGLVKQSDANFSADDVDGVVEAMAEHGGWWRKPPAGPLVFLTPSGKFEFFSQLAQARLAALPGEALATALAARGVRAQGDLLCLPHFETPGFKGPDAEFPYFLYPYRAINYAEGGIRHQRRLMELPISRVAGGRERVELATVDAEPLGIESGTLVVVETPVGSREMVAVVRPEMRPGALGLPLGYGHWPPRPSEVSGGYSLLDETAEDPVGGVHAITGTRARIRRAS